MGQRKAILPDRSESSTGNGKPPSPRGFLRARSTGDLADSIFMIVMLLCALSVVGIVILIASVLVWHSQASMERFGWRFLSTQMWNPVTEGFGALPLLFGTVVSSTLALLIAVPLSLAVAVFLLEICPAALRGPVSFLTEILAAIPSVVYGFWGLFVLVPFVRGHLGMILLEHFGWTGFFERPNFGIGMLTAGILLAIMIFPFICSVSRDVMRAVPIHQREAALALGATRWEMVRISVLRNARVGIVGAIMLGLGRALGETMAVTMVIGNHPAIVKNLFAPSATLASVIANEFSEANSAVYLSALIEVGLVLFLVTVAVNAVARLLVWFVVRDAPVVEA